jgi:hypothetical protein
MRHNRLPSPYATRITTMCLTMLLSSRLVAQGDRNPDASAPRWSLSVTGGGSYAMSDLEIVPGIDQNGGWGFDAGVRGQRGRTSIGLGYERLRLDTGPEGAATVSGIYAEPRLEWGGSARRLQPYLFVHGGRIVDYDVSFCCSVYPASSNARGWLIGGGFGMLMAPVGPVRFDVSAGVHQLSADSPKATSGTWQAKGPMLDLRIGAAIPLIGAIRGK